MLNGPISEDRVSIYLIDALKMSTYVIKVIEEINSSVRPNLGGRSGHVAMYVECIDIRVIMLAGQNRAPHIRYPLHSR